ncbi:MAG: putative type I restriction enzymeP M protein [Chloroflexi bacterium ADurb.Bin222]|nr:MAG: putative type I restriction enzymeP M protein [Chloroflexi bacterium ADurb.Bin222]
MNACPSLRLEGGLFSPDLLEALARADLPGQKPQDFGLPPRRALTEEIAAVYHDARALWQVFQHRLERLHEGDLATSETRDSWVIPFLRLLGYDLHFQPRALDLDGLTFAISHLLSSPLPSAFPVHIVGYRQELGRLAPSGRPRLSPHALVQEYLNRSEALWGLVTNGRTLRLLRNSTFVRRQAYVEFDLEGLFEEERFADFVLLYRLLHRTRLPGDGRPEDCLLEQYYQQALEQGGRVREHLREGVERCLTRLANGFLCHPDSTGLRNALREREAASSSPALALYRQLLHLVYRFLFLLVSEERGLMGQNPLYLESYGITRLRRLTENRAACTEDVDLWLGLRALWATLADEQLAAFLGIPPLNGELFTHQALDEACITNRDLLTAFSCLAFYDSPPRRVNYAALDTEELGSVYESLLDYHPAVTFDAAGRAHFELAPGSERKSTGSYYTPPQLVNELVRSALEPVIEERLAQVREAIKDEKESALLSIKVCDPACGSGHFLLAAARRLGKELARVRTGEDEPAPEQVRAAVRDVVAHCIYGVDKNPLAVELARVALWLESHAEGKPLTFLEHRLKCGDSLVGVFDLSVLEAGLPDEAFAPLAGDDKKLAASLKRQNQAEREGQLTLFDRHFDFDLSAAVHLGEELDAIPDDSPEQVRRKRARYEARQSAPDWRRQKEACDLWTAAFFQEFRPRGGGGEGFVTTETVRNRLAGRPVQPQVLAQAIALADEGHFFHWPLEFPEVFAKGGFDVILCNPPYDVVRENRFLRSSPMRGTGNLFAHFISRTIDILAEQGAMGYVVPLSLACGETFEPARRKLYQNFGLLRASHYSIRPAKLFPGVEQRITLIRALHRGQQPCRVYSTRLHRWHQGEEHKVIANAEFGLVGTITEGIIPKVAGYIGASIYDKIRSQPHQLREWLANEWEDSEDVYYHSVARYWIKAYNFIPFFQRQGEEPGISTTLKTVRLRNRTATLRFLCLLNSSLFYYWWLAHSDEFHVLESEVFSFGVPDENAPWPPDDQLETLVNNLMESYKSNAVRRSLRVRGGGVVLYDEFRPRRSLREIYAIDDAIAPLYSLTPEELEFLKTYDLEFRTDEE